LPSKKHKYKQTTSSIARRRIFGGRRRWTFGKFEVSLCPCEYGLRAPNRFADIWGNLFLWDYEARGKILNIWIGQIEGGRRLHSKNVPSHQNSHSKKKHLYKLFFLLNKKIKHSGFS
jgi:hypothetical protein